MKKIFTFILLFYILPACKEEDKIVLPSSIEITQIGNIEATSALIFTKIGKNESISESKIIVSSNRHIDSLDINNPSILLQNLRPGEDYEVRAYIKTASNVIYTSEEKTFTTKSFDIDFESDSIILGYRYGYELLGDNLPQEEIIITIGGMQVPFENTYDNRTVLHFRIASPAGMQPLKVVVNEKEIYSKEIFVPTYGNVQHPGQPPFAFQIGGLLAFNDAIFNVMSVYVDNINVENGEVHTNKAWRFDLETEIWSLSSNEFPGLRRNYPLSVTINEKGYLGFGSSDGEFFQDFWEFDPISQNWTQLPSPPVYIDDHPRYVSKGNKIYIYDQKDNFMSYDVQTMEWEILNFKNLAPVSRKPTYQRFNLQFTFGDNLYFLSENLTLSIFNPETKLWKTETIYDDGLWLRDYSNNSNRFFHYLIGDDLYIGYDYNFNKKMYTLYKFNLESNIINTNVYEFKGNYNNQNFIASQNEESVFLNYGTSCTVIKKVSL